MKDTLFKPILRLNVQGILREFSKPVVMGIINATPDSFYGGSRSKNAEEACAKALKMIAEGAEILDIGGYSSRPDATDITIKEEIQRVVPVIEAIRKAHPEILISIDTFRAEVAAKAVQAGANIINDISGGQLDADLFNIAAKNNCPYILMHMRGTPQTMKNLTEYDDLVPDILHYFSERIAVAKKRGVNDIIIDPGFGFSKTLDQNYELLKHLNSLQLLGKPILAGVSRKSMIYKKLNITVNESLNGTSVLNTFALNNGASILRVHDVKEAVECVELLELLK